MYIEWVIWLVVTHSFLIGLFMKQKEPLKGKSYLLRCKKINEIYDKWVKIGLSNREIYRRFIYPEMGISERTFYKALKADVPTTF